MRILILLILLCSCSTLKKTMIYSSLVGGVAGATAGGVLSPDKASRGANALVFGLIGASVALMSGVLLYQDDPRNFKLKSMLEPQKENVKEGVIGIDLENLKIEAKLDKKESYKVPLRDLPEKLKGKVKKQYLIKYQSKERYLNSGNKTFYIPSFEIYEHSYNQKIEEEYGQ